MFKIALNLHKPYNYAFFCPDSKLHLTVSNPVGFVHEVTAAISSGLRCGILIDVDNAIDLSTGKAKEAEQKPAMPVQNDVQSIPETPQVPNEVDNTGKKKRGRKATQAPVEEASNGLFDGINQ